MSTIKVICIDQALAFENTPLITSGGMDEDFVSFSFCNKWAGYTRTAVFWRNEADAYHVLLDEADTCQIPPEVTGDAGTIFFGVFGVNTEGKQRTSQVLTYHIEKGVITLGTAPSDPTPDIYTQFLAEVGIVKGLVQETRNAEANFETAMKLGMSTFSKDMEKDQADFMTSTAAALERYKNEIAEAAAAGLVPDGTITTARLADAAVTAAKLAAGAVTTEKLDPGAIKSILLQGVQLAFGSYTGTGTHGAANPNTLTFDFEPVFVLVIRENSPIIGGAFFKGSNTYSLIGWDGGTLWMDFYATMEGKTLSWYCDEDSDQPYGAQGQLNNNYKYFYVAFGVGGVSS